MSIESMREIYAEYSDILLSSDGSAEMKIRLSSLLLFAEAHGITGRRSCSVLKQLKVELGHREQLQNDEFCQFYRFVYFMCRERGQKNIGVDIAIESWRFVLNGRFALLDQWCSFVKNHHKFAVSEDTWRQLLDFCKTVQKDLPSYDSSGAWPVLIDDFVDCITRKPNCAICSEAASSSSNDACYIGEEAMENDSQEVLENCGSKRARSDGLGEVGCVESIRQKLSRMSASSSSAKRLKLGETFCCLNPSSTPDSNSVLEGSLSQWLPAGEEESDSDCNMIGDS